LVILSPDGAYQQVLSAVFSRAKSLGIRGISVRLVRDPLHDSSPKAVRLLMPFQRSHSHALAFRDFEGSGREDKMAPAELEAQIESELRSSGWASGSARAVVVAPEIEDWLRQPSPHIRERLQAVARTNRAGLGEGWTELVETVIADHGGRTCYGKPKRPKEVFEAVLDRFGVHPSNAHYRFLGEKESLRNCASPSFQRLLSILQSWFPAA
jgi:hypothetical protein